MNKLLIAFEGLDGSGKTTMVSYISDKLREIGEQVEIVATREKKYEKIFFEVKEVFSLDPNSEANMFYFQFLHADKVDRTIKAIKDGKYVIADRWDLSFYAWHENIGFFKNEKPELRDGISRLAFRNLTPDIGIYLDIPVEIALNRIQVNRGDLIFDIEKERQNYQKGISTYRKLASARGWITVDASDELEKVKQKVWQIIKNLPPMKY